MYLCAGDQSLIIPLWASDGGRWEAVTPFHSQRSQAQKLRVVCTKATLRDGQILTLGSLLALLPF